MSAVRCPGQGRWPQLLGRSCFQHQTKSKRGPPTRDPPQTPRASARPDSWEAFEVPLGTSCALLPGQRGPRAGVSPSVVLPHGAPRPARTGKPTGTSGRKPAVGVRAAARAKRVGWGGSAQRGSEPSAPEPRELGRSAPGFRTAARASPPAPVLEMSQPQVLARGAPLDSPYVESAATVHAPDHLPTEEGPRVRETGVHGRCRFRSPSPPPPSAVRVVNPASAPRCCVVWRELLGPSEPPCPGLYDGSRDSVPSTHEVVTRVKRPPAQCPVQVGGEPLQCHHVLHQVPPLCQALCTWSLPSCPVPVDTSTHEGAG